MFEKKKMKVKISETIESFSCNTYIIKVPVEDIEIITQEIKENGEIPPDIESHCIASISNKQVADLQVEVKEPWK